MARSTRRNFTLAALGASLAPFALPLATQAADPALVTLLPDEGEAPTGLQWLNDQTWTLPGMATNGSDPVQLAGLLSNVGWQGNITRHFGLGPGASLADDATTSVEVSLHQVASSDGASQLLAYFVADRAAAEALTAVPVLINLAAEAQGLAGSVTAGKEATVYARFASGGIPFVLRVTGYSPASSSMADVLNLCQAIVNKA